MDILSKTYSNIVLGLNTHLQNQTKSNAHKQREQNWFEYNSSMVLFL